MAGCALNGEYFPPFGMILAGDSTQESSMMLPFYEQELRAMSELLYICVVLNHKGTSTGYFGIALYTRNLWRG